MKNKDVNIIISKGISVGERLLHIENFNNIVFLTEYKTILEDLILRK